MSTLVEIRSDEKLKNMPINNRLIDVGTQLANILYGNGELRGGGKALNSGKQGILGTAQQVKVQKNNLSPEKRQFIVYVPEKSEKEISMIRIANMVKHAKRHGVDIKIVIE